MITVYIENQPRVTFDSVEAAIRYVSLRIYMSPDIKELAQTEIESKGTFQFGYGFSSVEFSKKD